MAEGTWVGLDVHARKVVAGVLDGGSGGLRTMRVPCGSAETAAWLSTLAAPVRVAYEAGPTGYGLARACAASGIACTVAVPSKIRRAPGDRVKNDRRDAERLARLLRLGELVAVRVPEPYEEQARDLVRAREDARGELLPNYPAPSSYLPTFFACGGGHGNGYVCNRGLDAEMTRTLADQLEDPRAGVADWMRIDHLITDEAYWVPTVTERFIDLVSKRVRNYEFSPVWGFIADQASVH